MIEQLDPFEIVPLHEPRNAAAVEAMAQDMGENGWTGRPLLVVQSASGFQAWTGSHRIAAAREADLSTVPCYVIQEGVFADSDVDATFGHVDDADRLKAL